MSAHPTRKISPTLRYAMLAWLLALVLFFAWLVMTLSGMRQPGKQAQDESESVSLPHVESNPSPLYMVEGLPQPDTLPTPIPHFDAAQEYVLVGYGLQGMHQQTGQDSIWTLSSPAPVLNAQLIKRGNSPEIVTEDVRIKWELGPQTSARDETAAAQADGENPQGEMKAPEKGKGLSFSAEIPLTAKQTPGMLNPYPVVTLTATSMDGDIVLARSATVVAVSPGYGCSFCHGDDGYGILEVHDRHLGTNLQSMARQGAAVNCRSCHSGLLTDQDTPAAGSGLSVSAAIHGWHVQYMPEQGPEPCLNCHSGLGRSSGSNADRPLVLFARDIHTDRGLNCTQCHGKLEDHALALLEAEKNAGQTLAEAAISRIRPQSDVGGEAIKPRLPWVQQPDCTGCHDFAVKPDPDSVSAFNKWTENSSQLFSSRSDNMDMVRCLSCHGAPHATYPSENPIGRDRDNIVPVQYQEHARPLGDAGNCALCHMQTMDFSAHHNLVTRKTTEIHVPADAELTLPPVHFPHSAHTRFECTVCHHTGHEDGKSLLCTSSGCHDGIKDQGTEDAPDPRYFRNAFHGPTRSCYYCHSTAKAEGRMAGPVACKDCHTAPSSRWTEQETAPDNANTNTAKSEKIGREKTDSVEQEKQDGATGSD